MAWITPKTDWDSTDSESNRFDYVSYNRIKNNINYLLDFAYRLGYVIESSDMGDEKTYTDIPYADEINKFGANLTIINNTTYKITITDFKTYSDNSKFISYDELNKIESFSLQLKTKMEEEKLMRFVLPITLSASGRMGVNW